MKKKEFYATYLKIVLPLMLQGMVTKMVSMVDNLMVGQLGDQAIAAVAVGNKILDIILYTLMGVTAAGSVFIAQYFGAQMAKKQQEVFRIMLLMALVLQLFASAALLLAHGPIIHFFVQEAGIEALASDYLLIMALGYIPLAISLCYGSALKVIGQVKVPLFASLVGVGVNTSLNFLLIFGNFGFPRWGVAGAAVATAIARLVELGLMWGFANAQQFAFTTRWRQIFQVHAATFREVLVKSLPLVANELVWAFGQATFLKLYAIRGSDVIAAVSINESTTGIFYAFSMGVSAATPVLVSQPLGASRFQEAYQHGKWMIQTAIGIALVLGLGLWGLSAVVPNLYQVSSLSHDLAVSAISISALGYWITLTYNQCYFIIRAGGDMKSTFIMDGGFTWFFTIPVIALLTMGTDLPFLWIFAAVQVCDFVKLLVSLRMFLKKNWLNNLTQ